MELDEKVTYETLVQFAISSEQTRWNRMYNFLTANSILILGWVTVFATAKTRWAGLFLVPISVVGIVGGILWAALSWRGTRFLHLFNGMGAALESGRLTASNCRPFQAQLALSDNAKLNHQLPKVYGAPGILCDTVPGDRRSSRARCLRRLLRRVSPCAHAMKVLQFTPLVFSALYVFLLVLGIMYASGCIKPC